MRLSDVDISRIRQMQAALVRAQHALDRECVKAREKGATWTELGYALNMSAQAAQKRYGTGSERAQATLERQAANALKRKQAAARRAKSREVSEG